MVLLATALIGGSAAAAPPTKVTEVKAWLVRNPELARKARGGLPLAFVNRPGLDGVRLPARERPTVLIRLHGGVTAADVAALERTGAKILRRRDGSPRVISTGVLAQVGPDVAETVARLERVETIELDGVVFAPPAPLDTTAADITATDVWRQEVADGRLGGGQGITICDSDAGIDVLHPMFFRADGGYFAWVDRDGSGAFEPQVDTVEVDGVEAVLRVVDGIISSFGTGTPMFGSDDPGYSLGLDWLYADVNGDGVRNLGRAEGFSDADPGFGEPLFVADDVDSDGLLDIGEKIVRLDTSKIAAVAIDSEVAYRRGENLIDTPRGAGSDHGSASASVLSGGQRGLSRLVGIAPEADLIIGARASFDGPLALTDICLDEGADVILHELAVWYHYPRDGSTTLERLIGTSSAQGVAHIVTAGNLRGADKQYKRALPPGITSTVQVLNPYGTAEFIGLTFLWRDPGRLVTITIESPTGTTLELPATEGEMLDEILQPGVRASGGRMTSDRGTSAIVVYFSTDPGYVLEEGTWLAHVHDAESPDAQDLELVITVVDDRSGWSKGVRFVDHVNEDHLVGHPGTADSAITVAAYRGTGHVYGGIPGELAEYSSGGVRIDGVPVLSVAAPDDPIAAGYLPGHEARYFVFGGTSGAAPHVAGVAALLLAQQPELTGFDVRQAIRDGADVDADVGEAPNESWGYGKLRAHRAIYGADPLDGVAPTIEPLAMDVVVGEPHAVEIAVADTDGAADRLVVVADLDYDGTYETTADGSTLTVLYETLGTSHAKLQVTDDTGRSAATLARFNVVERPQDVEEGGDPAPVDEPPESESCACRATGRHHESSRAWGWIAMALPLLRRRWRHRP